MWSPVKGNNALVSLFDESGKAYLCDSVLLEMPDVVLMDGGEVFFALLQEIRLIYEEFDDPIGSFDFVSQTAEYICRLVEDISELETAADSVFCTAESMHSFTELRQIHQRVRLQECLFHSGMTLITQCLALGLYNYKQRLVYQFAGLRGMDVVLTKIRDAEYLQYLSIDLPGTYDPCLPWQMLGQISSLSPGPRTTHSRW